MPFLRFTRDKRGYETTSLVHASRHRGRAGQRLLYWFRTPPGVKVGRPALDEDAIHGIEEHNPDIEFDWPKILEAQPPPPPPPEDGRRRVRGKSDRLARDANDEGRGKREEGRAKRTPRQEQPPARPASPTRLPPADAPAAVESGPVSLEEQVLTSALESRSEDADVSFEDTAPLQDASVLEDAPVPEDAPPMEDAPMIEDALEQITHPDTEELPAPTRRAIESVVGKEQLTRLRARYAELQARITERGGDAARVEELRTQAEALNPDTWVTDEEARKGLQGFDAKVRDLRAALGLRPRRRSRRGGRRRRRGGQGSPSGSPGPNQAAGSSGVSPAGPSDESSDPSKAEDFSE